MQDSSVTITITAVDGATKVFEGVGDSAVKNANKAAAAWQKANDVQSVSIKSTGDLGAAQNKASAQTDKFTASTRRSYFAQTALTTIMSAGINKAFLGFIDVTGQAIQRTDLLANFPKSMSALGLSAVDASASLKTLSGYIGQIGGNLQDATTSVTRFAEVTKNVRAATAEFVGVNNALIAGGAGQEVQKNALEQLTQAYSRGIPQLIEWRSLMVAMPAQLNQVAQAMKLPNAQALGEALTNGKVSMQDFVTELTKLSTGTGPIAQQALARMSGIQFAFNVMKNTMVQGMTAIIQTIGRQNITDFLQLLTQVIVVLAQWAVKLIGILFTLFNFFSRLFGGPQLKLANDATAGIADNLGTGAANAGDMADNLDDAGDSAKALQKGLASFDKMNVLADKTSGSGGKDKTPSAAGAPLGAADAAALGDIFDGIAPKMKAIGDAAKVIAGILAGLAANSLIDKIFGINPLKLFFKSIGKYVLAPLAKFALNGVKAGLTFGQGILQGLGGLTGVAEGEGVTLAQSVGLGFRLGVIKWTKAIWGLFSDLFLIIAGLVVDFLAFIGAVLVETLIAVGVVAETIALPFEVLVAIGVLIVAAIIALIWLIWTNWSTIMSWISTAAQAVWDFLVAGFNILVGAIQAVWNFLYDIFAAPIKWLIQFWEALFILVVAIVAIAIQLLVGLFVWLVKSIFDVLSAVAGWINDNVIQPTWQFFQWLWDTITGAVVAAWQWIFNNVLKPIAMWIFNNVITPVVNFFIGLWNGIVGLAVGFFNGITNVLRPFASWIYDNIISPVLGFFNWLWDKIKDGLSFMVNGLAGLFSGITNIVKAPINGIIDLLNDVLKSLNKVKVPDWVPGLGGKGVNFPLIPKLARGGIVQRSTLANIGENGSEAIVPLENNLEWIDKLAAKINSANGNNGMPIQLTVQIGEDKIATKVIDLINEKSQMSGRNAIFV